MLSVTVALLMVGVPVTSVDRGSGDFGDLANVCGPGDAEGATDVGVTDATITIGTGADPGNPIIPGLDQELLDTAVAFVSWCNGAGGILGRQLELHQYDAQLFNVGAVMQQACQGDFMLVGNGFGLDEAGVDIREGCGLPQIAAFTASARSGESETSLEPNASSSTKSAMAHIFRRLAEVDPAALVGFGMLNHDLASTRNIGRRDLAQAEQVGFKAVYDEEFPVLGVDNWRPYVENMRKAGVTVLHFVATPELLAPLMRTMSDVGWFPSYITLQGNMYDPIMIAEAGALLDRTTVLIDESIVPFEVARPGSATAQYVEILQRYVPGARSKALGVAGWSAFALFAVAAARCGSELTRTCVMEQATQVGQWTGGGLHAPNIPSNQLGANGDCSLVVQATSHGFIVSDRFTLATDGPFNCDPRNDQPLPTLAS